MSFTSTASLVDVELESGRPPRLRVEATGSAPTWAAEHRDTLRAVVAEHGSVWSAASACVTRPRPEPSSQSWPPV